MQFAISPPTGNARGPIYAESLLQSLHTATRGTEFTLLIRSHAGEVGLAIDCESPIRKLVVAELQDAYPGLVVDVLPDEGIRKNECALTTELWLTPDVFALRTYDTFLDEPEREMADPLIGTLSAIRSGRSGRVDCSVRLAIRPAGKRRTRRLFRVSQRLNRRFSSEPWRHRYARWATHAGVARRLLARTLLSLVSKPHSITSSPHPKLTQKLFVCRLTVTVRAPADAARVARAKLIEVEAALSRYLTAETAFNQVSPKRRLLPHRTHGFCLSAREIASLLFSDN